MIDHAFELRFYASNNQHVDDEKLNAAADYIDRLKQDAINQRDHAVCAEIKRDELAAHVERLRSALNYSSEYLYGNHLNTIGYGSKAHMEMVSALEDTPTTNLARRDAKIRDQARAKSLRETAQWFSTLFASDEPLTAQTVYDILLDQARRQTEGA